MKNSSGQVILATARLNLRLWIPSDLAPYAAMNADPEVRRYFPTVHTKEDSDAEAGRIMGVYDQYGYCFYAAELKATKEFAGFIGISTPTWGPPCKWAHSIPWVEIGWRLAKKFWGQGLATEGARAALEYGFTALKLPEIVALTLPINLASRRVMEKIGMTRDPADDFAHPRLAADHPMSRHVLYRAGRS
jgi:RimJ/RimL family protein N-acetyltransferase